MKTVIKYVMTNGLMATSELYNKPFLAKVCFAIMSDNSVVVTADNARNGSTMRKLGKKVISRQQLSEMPDDQYDSMVFNRAAFQMMGLSL